MRVNALVHYFETLTPLSLVELPRYYAADCRFRDPFNDVRGLPELQEIFRHMFERLDAPRFIVRERVFEAPRLFITWDFEFRFRNFRPGVTQQIHGSSLITLDDAGLVAIHRDYWDVAEELYEKLPLLGRLMLWLKKQGHPEAPI
jgi:steroid Delta-isomerase